MPLHYETMRIKLLLVDDDRCIRRLYRELLLQTQLNIEISEAADGETAIELFHTGQFDCVLLDYELPDMTAQFVLSAMQNGPILSTPVIIISSHSEYELPIELMESGATDYIHKTGVTSQVLRTSVLHALARGRFLQSQRDYTNALRDDKEHQLIAASQLEREKLKQTNQQLQHLAMHDQLTGLANRDLLSLQVKQLIHQAKRHNKHFALMFLDLDGFKEVNDSLGHSYGDLLLKSTSERLKKSLREEDLLARVGGDEFIIVLSDLQNSKPPLNVTDKIRKEISRTFHLGEKKVNISSSIGLAVYPEAGTTINDLIKNADTAMYEAKKSGKNKFTVYDPHQNQSSNKKKFENTIYSALRKGEMQLFYQPIYNLSSLKIEALEALIRWHSPTLGWVEPDNFIPTAEKSDLIIEIGQWVRKQTCRQISYWENTAFSDLQVCINASNKEFLQGGMDYDISQLINHYNIPPSKLKIEITERVIVDNIERNQSTFAKLRSQGIDIAVDDFGTGYSSLSYLKNFPIDALKIDASFIKNAPNDKCDSAITESIITMSRSLNIDSIAEGIENKKQLDFLIARGCGHGQGYYLATPEPAKTVYKKYYSQTACPLAVGSRV